LAVVYVVNVLNTNVSLFVILGDVLTNCDFAMINLHAHVYFCCSIQILVLSFVTSLDVSVLSSKRHFAVCLPVSFMLVILNIYLISLYTNSTLGE